MTDDFESFAKSQLKVLQAQVDTLKGYLSEYEDRNRKLKKMMSEELITALILRFERNEDAMRKINEKLDTMHMSIQDKFFQEIRGLKNDLSESHLSHSIAKLLEEKEIKVDSKPLNELKKDYEF